MRNISDVEAAWSEGRLHADIPMLAGSFFLCLVHFCSRAVLWHLVTVRLGAAVPIRTALGSYLLSLLGKYVPGKVFLYAARVYFYRKSGIRPALTTACFAIEMTASMAAAAFLFSLYLLVKVPPFPVALPIEVLRAIVVSCWVVFLLSVPAVLRGKGTRLLPSKLRALSSLNGKSLEIGFLVLILAYAAFNWILLGGGFLLLMQAMVSTHPNDPFLLLVSFPVSAVLGVLAIFAPAGLGVREGVLLMLIKYTIAPGVAAVVVIVSRLWLTTAELLLAGIAYLLMRHQSRVIGDSTELTAPSSLTSEG